MNTPLAATRSFSFDGDAAGALPTGWRAGATGRGTPHWVVEADATAPSTPDVRKQSGSGTFPWCVMQDVTCADGYLDVTFNGKTCIEMDDEHIAGAGAIGVWTKADSVTLFDDFTCAAAR